MDVSFNTRGMRLVASGYSQRVPRLFLLLLRRTLRHLPPNMGTPELAAARRAALRAATSRPARAMPAAPLGVTAELQRATPEQLNSEILRFFGSVRGASLLLSGDLSVDAAEALTKSVRSEIKPLLPPSAYLPDPSLGVAAQPIIVSRTRGFARPADAVGLALHDAEEAS